MTPSLLREVVELGGLALQREDRAIRAAVSHRCESGGLVRIPSEHYYQGIVWQAILPIWPAALEKFGRIDLAVDCPDGRHHFEMKNWTLERQIPDIQKDIYDLQIWPNRYILVTSANPAGYGTDPAGNTVENIKYLLGKVVGLNNNAREDFRFETVGKMGESMEFWVAGWPVLSVERPKISRNRLWDAHPWAWRPNQ